MSLSTNDKNLGGWITPEVLPLVVHGVICESICIFDAATVT
ncbi:hypothetical protein RRSWK_01607 [Rhodopirellula sp. SWK7]|nr:hypothetical protein RRSWK_01607 [Rhodopirellula sp. SWK7]